MSLVSKLRNACKEYQLLKEEATWKEPTKQCPFIFKFNKEGDLNVYQKNEEGKVVEYGYIHSAHMESFTKWLVDSQKD